MPKYVNPSASSIYKLNDRLLKWNKFITSFLCRRTNCLEALTSLLMLHEGMLSFRRKQRYFSALDNLWLSEKRAKGQRRIISELCFGRTKTNKSGVIACIRETMATLMTTSETVNLRGYLFHFSRPVVYNWFNASLLLSSLEATVLWLPKFGFSLWHDAVSEASIDQLRLNNNQLQFHRQ